MKKLMLVVFPLILFLSMAGLANATLVFEDHFDDGALGSA